MWTRGIELLSIAPLASDSSDIGLCYIKGISFGSDTSDLGKASKWTCLKPLLNLLRYFILCLSSIALKKACSSNVIVNI